VTEEDVASFLRANPGFLAGRPELYGALMPPRRTHGPVLADHMAAMIQAGRHEVARVLEAGRARQGLGARVGEAVLALLRTQRPSTAWPRNGRRCWRWRACACWPRASRGGRS
jgi:uncharacterized protein YigA (DUF484 family)